MGDGGMQDLTLFMLFMRTVFSGNGSRKQGRQAGMLRRSALMIQALAYASAVCVLTLLLSDTALGADVICVETRVPLKDDAYKEARAWNEAYKKAMNRPPQAREMCTVGAILGTIQAGDFDKVSALIRNSEGWLNSFALVSPGGNLPEALRIGGLIRQLYIATRAPEELQGTPMFPGKAMFKVDPCEGRSCICASACFLVWIAGANRSGSLLGVHRPSFDRSYFGALDVLVAEGQYRRAIDGLGEYVSFMNVPPRYLDLLMNTPSWELTIPSDDIKKTLESPDQMVRIVSPATDEWITARCGVVTNEMKSSLDAYVERRRNAWFKNGDRVSPYPSTWYWDCGDPSVIPDPAYRALTMQACDINMCRRTEAAALRFKAYVQAYGASAGVPQTSPVQQ